MVACGEECLHRMAPADFERRATARTGIPGTVVVLVAHDTSTFSIENLSVSGALLVGGLALAPRDRLKLLLHIDGYRSFGAAAEVVRTRKVSDDRYEVAVAFLDLAQELEDRIWTIVAGAIDRQQVAATPAVLVVDDDRESLLAIERDVRDSGRTVLFASTALEVVQLLQDRSVRVDAVLVELGLSRANPIAVLAHFADEHPRVRRIVMSHRAAVEYASELSSGRAHAFILRPWDRQTLIEALQ